jgi:hypothetical protein
MRPAPNIATSIMYPSLVVVRADCCNAMQSDRHTG